MISKKPKNDEIAGLLERIANLLEVQKANSFRVEAYRKGAQSVREAKEPVTTFLQKGEDYMRKKLPGVGYRLASVIEEYIRTGRSRQLERLEGEISPEDLFKTVPGIGDELAHRITSELDIETLEDLELAAHDGQLEKVDGFGKRRVEGIRETLAGMLSRSARRRSRKIFAIRGTVKNSERLPPINLILNVDAEYRRRAEADELNKIAPKRFNPEGKAWLSILHTEREGWEFTALFSNTARAHQLGTTRDWVIIYYEKNGMEGQCTVVTQKSGELKGKRIVRGREKECCDYYSTN